jgi:hypothetical protein
MKTNICNRLLSYAICMYCEDMDIKFLSLTEKLGLYPIILPRLSSSSSNLPKIGTSGSSGQQ